MKLKFAIIFLLMQGTNNLCAQSEISIGSKVPDLVLNNIVNYETTTAKISDFKDRLLILDFWATWCGPCVKEFPKLDSLQKVFGKQVQILAVTDQPAKIVTDYFTRSNKLINMQPRPSVTGDTVLSKLFTHSYIPHFAWIGRDGTVVAITDAEQVTGANIRKYLEGAAFSLPTKRDNLKLVDRTKPVFIPKIPVYNRQADNSYSQSLDTVDVRDMLVHSTFTKYIPGFPGSMNLRPSGITWTNTTIQNLYSAAFGKFRIEFMYSSRGIWEVKDSALYSYCNDALYKTGKSLIEQTTWKKEHCFCYEIQVPSKRSIQAVADFMAQELNLYFGTVYNIEGVLEKRKVKCLALVRTSTAEKFALKDTAAENVDIYGLYKVQVVNGNMENLVNNLYNELQGYFLPLVDETGYKGKVDIELNGDLQTLDILNAQLVKYDLKLTEKESVIDMVVIKTKEKK